MGAFLICSHRSKSIWEVLGMEWGGWISKTVRVCVCARARACMNRLYDYTRQGLTNSIKGRLV